MSKQPKPAKRRASAGERLANESCGECNICKLCEVGTQTLARNIDLAIRAAVKDAAHCEREFVYDALSDMGHHALCKQLKDRINRHTRKYGVKL